MKPLVEKLKPYAWDRIQLLQQKRYDDVLDDKTVADMARLLDRPTAQQMFGGVGRRMAENQELPVKVSDE